MTDSLIPHNMENNIYYCILKSKYDSFFLLEHRVEPQSYFLGIQITKKNIHNYCLYADPSDLRPTYISKQFFDSIMTMVQCARNDIVGIINNQRKVGRSCLLGSAFFILLEDRIYICKTTNVFSDGTMSYSSISVETEDCYYDFTFDDFKSVWIERLAREYGGYHLDESIYDVIENKAHQIHQIIRTLVKDKMETVVP